MENGETEHLFLKRDSAQRKIFEAIFRIVTPFGIGAIIFFALFLTNEALGFNLVKMFSTYAIPVIGPVASAGAGIGLGVHPAIVVLWLTTIEVCGALLVWLNSIYLEKLPKLGQLIHKAEQASHKFLAKHPWALPSSFSFLSKAQVRS
jgi:hypothetical protein